MKKIVFYISLMLLFLSVSNTFAQRVYNSTGKALSRNNQKQNSKFDIHKVIVGGNLRIIGQQISGSDFKVGSNYSSVMLAPVVGYKITNKFHAGMEVGYYFNRYKFIYNNRNQTGTVETTKVKTPIIYTGPWARYFVFNQFFLSTEIQLSWYKNPIDFTYSSNADGTLNWPTATTFGPSVLPGVGYANMYSSNFYYAIWIRYDVLQDPNSLYYSYRNFSTGLDYKVGLFIGL